MKKKILSKKIRLISFLIIVSFIGFTFCTSDNNERSNFQSDIHHITVYQEEGKYGGWPANWGTWLWNNEILVSFTKADHAERESSHTFDSSTGLNMFARSLDEGQTWTLEDAYENGITGATFEHNLGDKSENSISLLDKINFNHSDFAFTFRAHTLLDGPTSFYYSYDRGHSWQGPYKLEIDFKNREPVGIVSRTDYIIEGEHEMTAFLTVGFRDGDENWREVAAVHTEDGGITWNFLSWIGPERVNSIMPSSVRLDESRILTMIRRTNPPEMASYISEDNGYTWQKLDDPVKVDSNGHPPALLKLQDGRLCLIYGIRRQETMNDGIGIYAVFSEDDGMSWSEPILLRGRDGGTWDIGYPTAIQLPSNNIVTFYYYSKINGDDNLTYELAPRTIEATIFNPSNY